MDQQDVFVEQLAACGREGSRCYRARGAWHPLRVIVDTIGVRVEPARVVRLEFTEHGPIVAEDTARHRAFVLRFVGAEPGTAGYLAQLAVDRATDWQSFRAAAARWKLPTENLVYGDVDGHIGWIAAGLMPVRSWSGLLPVPGDGHYEWRGFLRPDDLPQSYDPPDGMIVTANNNILPPKYSHALNYEWAAPYRAQRIAAVLRATERLTTEDCQRLQLDEYSLPASRLVPVLVAAGRRAGGPDRVEIDTLQSWDDVMARERMAPLLYESWLRAVTDRLGRRQAGSGAEVMSLPLTTVVRLLTAPEAGFGPRPEASRDSLVLAALDDAVAELTATLGADRSRWSWGALHHALFHHPLAAAFDLPATPRGGDGNTVNATGGADYIQEYGASYREILDFADWDRSLATSVPGQSGQPGSPYYDNLLQPWADGRYFPLVYTRARVEQETAHLLTLTPPARP